MELDSSKYSYSELLKVMNIDDNDNINEKIIQSKLNDKIISILNANSDDLPESKDNIIKFFTKTAFSIVNNKKKDNNENINEISKPIPNEENEKNLINDYYTNFNSKLLPTGYIRKPLPNQISINTNNNRFVQGLVNPVERETYTTLLSINSKFRNEYTSSSTDFTVNLNEPYHNVVSLKLASFEYINSYYNFSNHLRTNRFRIEFFQYHEVTEVINTNSKFDHTFIFNEGHYNICSLIDVINELFIEPNQQYSNILFIDYIDSKGKIIFKLNPGNTSNLPANNHLWGFNLDFRDSEIPNRVEFLNFSWLLGYRKNFYYFFNNISIDCCPPPINYEKPCNIENSNYVIKPNDIFEIGFNPESVANFIGTHYFLLEVDDFNKNQTQVFKSNSELQNNIKAKFTYSFSNILARIPNIADAFTMGFEDSSDRVFKTRKYLGPIKLSKLKIRLLDENGNVVNFLNNDIIINLEIESINKPYC